MPHPDGQGRRPWLARVRVLLDLAWEAIVSLGLVMAFAGIWLLTGLATALTAVGAVLAVLGILGGRAAAAADVDPPAEGQ